MFRHPQTPRSARRVTLGGLAALILALGASLLPALPAHSATGGGTIHALVNEARFADGQPGLIRNSALDDVAAAWAAQMAGANTMSHNPEYAAQIPGGWVSAGENVAQGQQSEPAMHEAWMNSSGHRANILGDFTDVGIAFLSANGTTWGVEVFASYPGHVGPAAPAPPAAEPVPVAPVEAATPVEEAAPATKSRTAAKAAESAESAAEPAPDPTPAATADATSRESTTYRSSSSSTRGDEIVRTADIQAAPSEVPWLLIGAAPLALLVAAAVLIGRRRGLIGPPSGRHSG